MAWFDEIIFGFVCFVLLLIIIRVAHVAIKRAKKNTVDSIRAKQEIREKNSEKWDFSQERVFIENLLCQRFNFFIITFSLIVAGAVSSKNKFELVSILTAGLLLLSFLGFTVYRIYVKAIIVLIILHNTEGHTVKISGMIEREGKWPLSFPVNDIIGYIVPILCNVLLVTGTILALCDIWKPA